MSLAVLKKELKTYDKPQLIALIADLYSRNRQVQEFLEFYLNPDEKSMFQKYRQAVVESFYPKRGFGYKLAQGKKAISEFRKLGPSPILVVELMFAYVETGTRFTLEYGDIDEPFYNSLESTYQAGLKHAAKNGLLAECRAGAKALADKANGLGWGFSDTIWQIYGEFYS